MSCGDRSPRRIGPVGTIAATRRQGQLQGGRGLIFLHARPQRRHTVQQSAMSARGASGDQEWAPHGQYSFKLVDILRRAEPAWASTSGTYRNSQIWGDQLRERCGATLGGPEPDRFRYSARTWSAAKAKRAAASARSLPLSAPCARIQEWGAHVRHGVSPRNC